MGDRAYTNNNAASNPLPAPPGRTLNGGSATGTAKPPTPAGQQPTRVVPPYRPKPYPPPSRRRHVSRRSCCCACCLWLTLLIIGLVFLAAIAAGVLYVIYHPRKPAFNVTSLRLSSLNVSSSDLLSAQLDLTVTARNPNQKIAFSYGDVSISAFSNSIDLADGSIPAFTLEPGNVSVIRVSLSSSGRSIDPAEAADLMKKKSYPLEIELDTKAGVRIGRLRSFRIAIRVTCSGISVSVAQPVSLAPSPSPVKSAPPPPVSIDAKCKPKIKIWTWTF